MLLIDSGNSAIKCRLLQRGQQQDRRFPVYSDPDFSAFSEYLSLIKTSTIVLACVSVAETRQRIIELVRQYHPDAGFTELTSLPRLNGLRNGYHDFARLGVDRWLAMIALTPLNERDYIVIDAGSAITIDLVSRSQGHLGGAILPGFKTTAQRFRSLFPQVDFAILGSGKIISPGHDTTTCIDMSEAPYSVDGVLNLLNIWQELLLPPYEILLTGHDAALISAQLEHPHRIITDLVFAGMLKQIQLLG